MDKEIHITIENVKCALEACGITIRKIVLFGSHARGTGDENSDIDLAVISNDFQNMNLLERLEFTGTALAKAKIFEPVEIRAFTEEEFLSQKEGNFIADEIRARGVEIL